jgi:hypothetical protein
MGGASARARTFCTLTGKEGTKVKKAQGRRDEIDPMICYDLS